jgi:hypothetical protein
VIPALSRSLLLQESWTHLDEYVVPYNDSEALKQTKKKIKDTIWTNIILAYRKKQFFIVCKKKVYTVLKYLRHYSLYPLRKKKEIVLFST